MKMVLKLRLGKFNLKLGRKKRCPRVVVSNTRAKGNETCLDM